MAKELEPRLEIALSKLHEKGGNKERSPFFFFKLNTRSPKDSVYYKDKSVFASIDKVRRANGRGREREREGKIRSNSTNRQSFFLYTIFF
jgi:hypothetical protein